MRQYEYIIDDAHSGIEIGRLLRASGYSRAAVIRLKYGDGLFLNGRHIRTIDKAYAGDTLTVCFRECSDAEPNPSLSAAVLYDDDDIAVFDKPAGMPVHRSNGHNADTLENLFAAKYPDTAFHAVSRLDRNTSGIVTVAKNKFAASKLMSDERYRPKKLYYAVIDGGFYEKYGEVGFIEAPIARESDSIIKRVVREDGDYARTEYRVLRHCDDLTFLEISLVTGRTHQIRVHMASIGHPLAGDDMYGGSRKYFNRQCLHCSEIRFTHPITNQIITIRKEPQNWFEILQKNFQN